ncbi:hypothetical protein OSB04_028237 [Centaurea solstitialis]|uniref:Uncharacterized protein n=1 Tax=Centaurea solstitialis TaxID=347529 RepID=A0AA38WAZ2_9ASTR|nr:hypothetical protein OSB04_028237 [Centaurea solstitialis]
MALQAKDNYFDTGSTGKPPRFNKDNFALWKTKMKLFLSGADPQIPYFLEHGPHIPTQTVHAIPAVNDQSEIPAKELEKPMTDWNDEDRRLVNIDTKAGSLLAMSLPDDVFHSYESFIHQKDETLSQTHQRFNCLLIDLKTIGTVYSNSEVITKFMEALPEYWETYTTCLTMSKDIKTLTLSELYDIHLNREQQKKLKKNLIRDTKDTKSTSLALVSNSVPPISAPSSSVTITELESSDSDISASDTDFNESLILLIRPLLPTTSVRAKGTLLMIAGTRKGKGLIAEDFDWDDVSSDESSDEEDTQVALMTITDEPTLALMAKIEEVPEEAPAKAPEASSSATESSSQCHEKTKQLTIPEENYKDQVLVNQTLCIERERALAAKERALVELKAKKVTIKGWSDASERVDDILASGRNVKNKKGLGFTPGCPRPNRSMLKFGMFVSFIPDPNNPENISSSTNSHTEGAHKSKNKTVKEKSKTVTPSKTKNPKSKKNKVFGGGPSVSGTKSFFQNPTPRLKIDLKLKAKEKKPIPPVSDAKGVLGTGPAHLKFKDFLDPTKRFIYHKRYHCGLNDHIASKSPDATKAEKSATVKKNPKAAKTVKGNKVVKTVPSVKTPTTKTDKSVEAATDSTKPTDNAGSIVLWVPKKT